MARPKKNLIKEVEEVLIESTPSVEDANLIQKENLEARKVYLYHLREDMVKEGIDTIGKLDVLLSKVLQEIESLK